MLTQLITHKNYAPKERKSDDGYFITVAGNVGAGKSTFTEIIGEKMNFSTSFEKVANNPYLADFYEDQAKWGFHLQLYFLSQRFQDQKRIGEKNENHIQDRSIYEDVEIFAKNLYDSEKMSKRDFNTYSELFHCMMSPYLVRPDLMIFLDGSLETVLDRIQKRGRDIEKKVPVAYWQNLHERYRQWIRNYKESPVLMVNIDEVDLVHQPKHAELITKSISKALAKSEAVTR